MNPKIDYAVLQERSSIDASWHPIHLHAPQWKTKGGKIEYDPAKNRIAVTLCGLGTSNDMRKFRSFGVRSKFNARGVIAPGLEICRACEQIRAEEPEPVLYCVQYERLLPNEDNHVTWMAQEPEYFHATSREQAQEIVRFMWDETELIRVVGCAPAVGFKVEGETSDGKLILTA